MDGDPNPNPNSNPNLGGDPPPAATRPDYIPEKFWDAAKGQPHLEKLARGYSELELRQSQGKAAFKAEYDAERLRGRPAAADKYDLKIDAAKLPDGLVILDKEPGEDFQPEATKRYFVLDGKDPLLAWWRQFAWDNGLSNDQFMSGVHKFAEVMSADAPTREQAEAGLKEEYAKLGEHGEARAKHVWGRLQALLGPQKAEALDDVVSSAAQIEALEALLERAGEAKFAPSGDGHVTQGSPQWAVAEIQRLQADEEFQKKFLDRKHPQHKAAFDEMLRLQKLAVGQRAA